MSVHLLGAFAELRKVTISFVMPACQSAWNSDPTGRILKKFDTWGFFRNSAEKIQASVVKI